MSSESHTQSAKRHTDSIIKDQEAYEGKKALMKRQRSVSVLNGISMVFAMAAGPVLASGIGMLMKTGLAAAISAGAVTTLGVALALGAVAVTTSYLASRKGQSSYIDNAEFNSQENARHIAAALKKEGVCVVPAAQPLSELQEVQAQQRPDGQSWQQYLGSQQQAATQARVAEATRQQSLRKSL